MKRVSSRALPVAVGLALGGAGGPAGAAAGWYVGVGGGMTSADEFDEATRGVFEAALIEAGLDTTLGPLDADDDVGVRVFGGFQFNDYFALEGYYVDLGDFEVSVTGPAVVEGGEGGEVSVRGDIGFEAQGFGVFGVLTYPVGAGFSLLGKAGGIHWDTEVPTTINAAGEVTSTSTGDDGTGFAWGGGLRYRLTEHLAVDAQYEVYTTSEDVELLSGNVIWSF
jgi:OOP family OmpA-OmpF porin